MNRGRILSHAPRYYFAFFLIALFVLLTSSQLIAQGNGGEPPFSLPEPPAIPMLSLAAAPVTINQFPASTTPLTVTLTNSGTGPAQEINLQMDGGLLTLPISQTLGTLEAGQSLTTTLPLELIGYAVGEQSLLLTTEAISLTNPVQAVATLTLLEPAPTNPFAVPGLNGEDGQTQKGEEETTPEFHLLQVQRPLTSDYRGRILTFTLHNSQDNTQDLTLTLSQWLPGTILSPENLQLHYLPDAPKEGQSGEPSLIAFRYDPDNMALNFVPAGDGQYLITSGHQVESMSGGSPDDPEGWVPTFNQPTMSLFTGSASYQYPLLTPPGPGLFQPTLALSYSGAAGNGMAGRAQNDAFGFGWNLAGTIEVAQSVTFCFFDTHKVCPINVNDNGPGIIELTLSIGGTGYELTHVGGTNQNGYPGRYILKGNTSFYVEYCHYTTSEPCFSADNGDGTADGAATATTSKGYWVVKDSQNTQYRLGYTTLSEQELIQEGFANGSTMGSWAGNNAPGHALRWRVDKVEDRFDIVSSYTYSETLPSEDTAWSASVHDGLVRAPASYLMKIEYGFNQILFDYSLLGPFHGAPPSYPDPAIISWQTNILARVEIRSKDYETGIGNYNLVRAYTFGYVAQRHGHDFGNPNSGISQQTTWCRGHYTAAWDWRLALLTSITELDSNGQAKVRVNNVNKADVEFAYWWHKTGYWSDTSTPPAPPPEPPHPYARYCAPYLTKLYTPYNPGIPVATFTYNEATDVYHSYNGPAWTTTWFNTIITQTVSGGWTTDAPPQITQFSYANAHYGGKARTDQWGSHTGAFQGFQTVTRTLMSGGSPHSLELNRFRAFDFNAINNQSALTGTLEWQELRTNTNKIVARSEEIWTMLAVPVPLAPSLITHLPVRIHTFQYSPYYGVGSSHNVGTRTDTIYDHYGNPTQVREYGGDLSAINAPYRVQETLYVHNTNPANWLVGLPWQVTVWDGEPNLTNPSKIISRQRTRYDGAACTAGGSQVPVNALVTATDVYHPGGGSNQCDMDFVTTVMTYGLYGDLWWQLSQTSSPTGIYPTVQYNSQWIYWRNHSSIEKVSNPLGDTLYGFNDSHTPWLFTDKTAPNGAKTRYEYDNFGRLIKQYTPDATTGQATVWSQQISYKDNAPWGGDYGTDPAMPLYIDTITVPSQSYSATSRNFYDALGRTRQQRSWNLVSDFDKVVTDTEYNELGQAICQTTPIVTTWSTFNADLNCTSWDHTTTSYTRSGSLAITTGIDGLISRGLTLGRTSLGVDPLGRLGASNQDQYGRLKSVEEINITHNPFTNPGFDTNQWWLSPDFAAVTSLNGATVVQMGRAGAGGGWYAANHNTQLSHSSSFVFRFQLSGNNHSTRIMLQAPDGSASLQLEVYGGQIYPRYTTSTAGNGMATAIQIPQVGNVWYQTQISIDKNGQPTWRVWREDGIGDPDKQFTWTVTNPAVLNVLKMKTWSFIVAPGTAGAGVANLYLGGYQEGNQYITQYAYDKANNLTSVTDAVGNVTTLTYDKLGRKLTMSDPDMGSWTYAYDLAGNLIRQTDAKYQRLCFTYDLQNRLLNKKDDGLYSGSGADNCMGGGTTLASYTYHGSGMGRGQVATIQGTNNGVTFNDNFSYDYRGRVTNTIRTIAGFVYTLGTGYDLLDRPTTLTYPGGEVVTTGYDKQVANSLSTSSGPTTLVSNVTYNHRLEMTGMVLGNNLTQSYVYFGATENYRLDKALLKVNGGSNIYYREYEYDDVGNITQFITSVAGQVQEEQFFTYDSLGRLKTAKAVGGPAPYDHSSVSTDYDYDAIGNLVNMAGTPLGYQDNAHKHAATHRNGSQAFTYDNNGNMVTRIEGSTTYTQVFDVENRLKTVSLTGNNAVTNFAYDASGQRLRTAVAPAGSPVANDTRTFTTYPFPGYEVEQKDTWQYLCSTDRGGECSWQWGHTSTVTRKTYFLGRQAVATRVESLPAQSGDGYYYLHSDHLGSSSLLTNSSGVKVTGSETRYYPYGAHRLAPTMPADNITDHDFTGQKENLELGLIYYNARYYVPGLGRFLTADTVVPDSTNPQAFNRYSYVLDNPLGLVDSSGHCAQGYADAIWDDHECYEIAYGLAGKYDWEVDDLVGFNWKYGLLVSGDLKGGGADITYELLTLNGNVAQVDESDVYEVRYEDSRALVKDPGTDNNDLDRFIGNADAQVGALRNGFRHGVEGLIGAGLMVLGAADFYFGAQELLAAPVSSATGPSGFGLGVILGVDGTRRLLLGGMEFVGGLIGTGVKLSELMDDIATYQNARSWAEYRFDQLTQSQHTLIVDQVE